MRVVYEYSHLGGSEILQVRYPECERDIYEVIASVSAQRSKVSEEKTKRGRLLYSPRDMNRQSGKPSAPGVTGNSAMCTPSPFPIAKPKSPALSSR